jgi:hypothetical protein
MERHRIDAALLNLRNRTYASFVELGRAPSARELGDETDVKVGWRQLHDAHALVLNPATDEIRMANPFSAVPTRLHRTARRPNKGEPKVKGQRPDAEHKYGHAPTLMLLHLR